MVQLRGLAYNQKTGDLCVDTDLWTTQAKLTKKIGPGCECGKQPRAPVYQVGPIA